MASLSSTAIHIERARAHNLKSVFKTIRNYLAANAVGITRDEVFAQQIINLIFCKIHDERTPGRRRFWVKGTERNTPEGQAAIARR